MNESIQVSEIRAGAKALGLTGPFPQHQYVQYLERAFGRDGSRFLDAVDQWTAQGGPPQGAAALYRMLARKPAMAEYVTRHQYSQLYLEFGEVLAESGLLTGHKVIDFGCGFGLFAQLLARAYPNIQVVGYDRKEIIQAALTRTRRQNLDNLSFTSDLKALAGGGARHIVLMFCTTHEMFPSLLRRDGEILVPDNLTSGELPGLLGDAGILITVNRFPYPDRQLPRLDGLMAAWDLHPVDVGLGAELSLIESGHTSNLPIRAFRRSDGTNYGSESVE